VHAKGDTVKTIGYGLLALVVTGCSAKPASVHVLIDDATTIAPASLQVSLFSDFGLLLRTPVKAQLPGALELTGLPPRPERVRVVVKGAGATPLIGATAVTIDAAAAHDIHVSLAAHVKDSDGDDVPDALDDCPTVADPDQADSLGFGGAPGDRCRGNVRDGGAPDPCAGLALCDGFDAASGMIDASKWTIATQAGTLAIDGTRAFRGRGSLKVHLDALDGSSGTALGFASVIETATFPASDLFVREFVFVPSGFVDNPAAFTTVEQASGDRGFSLQLEHGGLSTFNDLVNPGDYRGIAGMVPKDTWTCIEWEVPIAAAAPTHVWVDGSEVPALGTMQSTLANPPVAHLALGMAGIAAGKTTVAARDLWIDEVAVDSARVGCDR
jgi:hypothetical protein